MLFYQFHLNNFILSKQILHFYTLVYTQQANIADFHTLLVIPQFQLVWILLLDT